MRTSLAHFVADEKNLLIEKVTLLRHSNSDVKKLESFGASIEEHTAVQRAGHGYDYEKIGTEFLIVVTENFVHGVYKVGHIPKKGTLHELASKEYEIFLRNTRRSNILDTPNPHLKFDLTPLESLATGKTVYGWDGGRTRTAIPKNGGDFFKSIEVDIRPTEGSKISEAEFYHQVKQGMVLSVEDLDSRLSNYSGKAEKVLTSGYIFIRNPYVVARTLKRACGKCEKCKKDAPFLRKTDGSPYLEVHHIKPLAEGGDDTVENAVALCPNCHRRAHFGIYQ